MIPHGWKTGITAAAQRHFQAATPNASWIELFYPALFESILPSEPGLGVTLDEAVVERLRVAPAAP